jgi:hypothetical protein
MENKITFENIMVNTDLLNITEICVHYDHLTHLHILKVAHFSDTDGCETSPHRGGNVYLLHNRCDNFKEFN